MKCNIIFSQISKRRFYRNKIFNHLLFSFVFTLSKSQDMWLKEKLENCKVESHRSNKTTHSSAVMLKGKIKIWIQVAPRITVQLEKPRRLKASMEINCSNVDNGSLEYSKEREETLN